MQAVGEERQAEAGAPEDSPRVRTRIKASKFTYYLLKKASTQSYMFFFAGLGVLRLEQQVLDKEAMERELYSRFVMVLNGKKAKIRGLQDTLHQLQQAEEDREHAAGCGFLYVWTHQHSSTGGLFSCSGVCSILPDFHYTHNICFDITFIYLFYSIVL